MEKSNTPIIFDKNTVEFVTVAAEFCGFLERVNETKRRTFVDTALKLLPLLYLKASLLPQGERIDEFDPETFVTEGDYERVRCAIAALMGEKDDYLDVFLDDMSLLELQQALGVPVRTLENDGEAFVEALCQGKEYR